MIIIIKASTIVELVVKIIIIFIIIIIIIIIIIFFFCYYLLYSVYLQLTQKMIEGATNRRPNNQNIARFLKRIVARA